MLLKNCIQLLAKEKYPQIVTSSHFMLWICIFYFLVDTNPANPRLLDERDEEDIRSECRMNHEKGQVEEEKIKTTIKSLTPANMKEQTERERPKYKALPISGTIEERCLFRLEHVTYGLECLRYFPIDDNARTKESGRTREGETKIRGNAPECSETFLGDS